MMQQQTGVTLDCVDYVDYALDCVDEVKNVPNYVGIHDRIEQVLVRHLELGKAASALANVVDRCDTVHSVFDAGSAKQGFGDQEARSSVAVNAYCCHLDRSFLVDAADAVEEVDLRASGMIKWKRMLELMFCDNLMISLRTHTFLGNS
jgi:hypothetical protein